MTGMIIWSICVSVSLVLWFLWSKKAKQKEQHDNDYIDVEFTVINDFKLDIRV